MKRLIFLAMACLIAVISCEIPQSVTVRGTPGIYLPLGNPFEAMAQDQRIENLISMDSIKEAMSGVGMIYEYTDPAFGNTLVYLLQYPIMEMRLDLSESINEALSAGDEPQSYTISSDIPVDQGLFNTMYPNGCFLTPSGPSSTAGAPLFSLDLSSMARLIKRLEGTAFGLELDDPDNIFFGKIRIEIPGFGISYATAPVRDGTKIRYIGSVTQFNPFSTALDSNNNLPISVKITGPCSGTITPGMIFEWDNADIDTSGNELNGEYPLDLELRDFLGSGVSFNQVRGYIYIGGVGDNAAITLTSGSTNLISNIDGTPASNILSDRERPVFTDPFTGSIPPDSLANDYINLAGVFNSATPSAISYSILIPAMRIDNSMEDRVIYADMVICLPLEFRVTNTSPINSNYVKLELGDVLPDLSIGDGGDLFFRSGNEDDLFNQIDTVSIILKNKRNTIFEDNNLSIMVSNSINGVVEYTSFLNFSDNPPRLDLDIDEIGNPFSPRFEILLRKETGQNYALLKIKRTSEEEPAEFDFFIAVEAVADINYTITFQGE
ncbi:MAG: hypothetical protein LBH16_07005 [Treponema sp.]|jgi:hypothetical protein|nr:hypothetical protein [Treponema sp.]